MSIIFLLGSKRCEASCSLSHRFHHQKRQEVVREPLCAQYREYILQCIPEGMFE